MFLKSFEIEPNTLVADIVRRDYRTADVFRKYGIEYCCGGKWPFSTACQLNGIDEKTLRDELNRVMRTIQIPATIAFEKWSIDFLTDYIVNVHHSYLDRALPNLKDILREFVAGHSGKFNYLQALEKYFTKLYDELIPHMRHEEEVIFPYIRQVAHAYEDGDSFGTLLVKTLRKPSGKMMDQEHHFLTDCIFKIRELTHSYTPPERACTNHQVVFSKLRELDNDMTQHMFLESDMLFPRVIAMEKQLLESQH